MKKDLVYQLLLLLLLSASCLAVCSSKITTKLTTWNGKCDKGAKKYDLCNNGRGVCFRGGANPTNRRLKCFDGLPCGCFPEVSNGHFELKNPPDNTQGATAELTCHRGYRARRSTITCNVNSTWSLPSRKCRPVDCGVPPSVQHGSYDTPTGFKYPAFGRMVCAEGFVLTHSSPDDPFIRCDENGDWILGSATCEPIACGAVPVIDNGDFLLTDPLDRKYGATAALACSPGYYASGQTTVDCTVSGNWSLPPGKCKPKDCGDPPLVQNGTYVTPSGTTYPETGHLMCVKGFFLTDDPLLTCGVNGTWIGGYATCEPIDCGVPPSVQHGYYETPAGFEYAAFGRMVCAKGFVLTYSSPDDPFIRCDENGDWNLGSATCEPIDCGNPPTLAHGEFNASSGTSYQSEAHLVCDDNYFPDNDSQTVITCEASGKWTTPHPTCVTPACGAIPAIINGDYLLTDPLDRKYRATADLTCSPGYYASGQTKIECTVSGEWSLPSGTCEPKDCGDPPLVQNGIYVTPSGTTYPEPGYLMCANGSVLADDPLLTCGVNGTWNVGSATCEPIECGDPPSVEHGVFNASSGTGYLSEAFLVCDNGARPLNASLTSIVCQGSGDWSEQYTVCVTKGCYCDTGSWHYSNKWSWTRNGVECQRWDQQTPHTHSYWRHSIFPPGETYVTADNYCRDVTGGGYPPWCVTTDPDVFWDYCEIPTC